MPAGIAAVEEGGVLPAPRAVVHPLPPTTEFLYGRVYLRGLDEMVLGVRDDTLTLKSYSLSRADGVEFAAKLLALGLEIQRMAEDMREFVKTYESEKWED